MSSDDMYDLTEPIEPTVYEITMLEAHKLRAEARAEAAKARARAALSILPRGGDALERMVIAWFLTRKGFSEFYRDHVRELPTSKEIHLKRDSRLIGNPIQANRVTTDTEEAFAKALAKEFGQRDVFVELTNPKQRWHVELPSVMVSVKKNRRDPAAEEPVRWERPQVATLYGLGVKARDMADLDKCNAMVVAFAQKLATRAQLKALDKVFSDAYELAHKRLRDELKQNPARNAMRERKGIAAGRRKDFYRKFGEALDKKSKK